MLRRSFSLLGVLVALCMLGTGGAEAKKPDFAGKGHGKSHSGEAAEGTRGEHNTKDGAKGDTASLVGLLIGETQRATIRTYLHDDFARHCPPGLAKKRNGCLPPGQAKKYRIGGMLPAAHFPIPHELVTLLGPPPAGAYYAMVDKDVLLVSEASKKILDAVTLLSAVQ